MSKTNRKIHPECFQGVRGEGMNQERLATSPALYVEQVRISENDACRAGNPESKSSRRSSPRDDAHRDAARGGTSAALSSDEGRGLFVRTHKGQPNGRR